MNLQRRTMHSAYMEWAKLSSAARFNLATSGVVSVPRAEFPLDADTLEITSTHAYGFPPLQQRLAEHAGVPEECVVAAAGTSMANHLAMAAVLSPGDELLVEQPAYGPLLEVAEYLGARINRIPRRFENAFAVDAEEVRAAMTPQTKLIILTNLHNPTSVLLSRDTLRAVGQIALRGRARVLVDEVYLEMLFDQNAPWSFPIGEALAGPDENPFIVTNSLTKAYGLSGLRCGWVLAAPELTHRMWRLNDLFGAKAAHPAEHMSVTAFDHLAVFRQRAESLLETNRRLLDDFLDSRQDLECVRPGGGSVVFPRLRAGDPERFIELLRDKFETSVVPGRFFEMPQHFRLGISGDTTELCGGLERVGAALDAFFR